jgi:hypothetical protein
MMVRRENRVWEKMETTRMGRLIEFQDYIHGKNSSCQCMRLVTMIYWYWYTMIFGYFTFSLELLSYDTAGIFSGPKGGPDPSVRCSSAARQVCEWLCRGHEDDLAGGGRWWFSWFFYGSIIARCDGFARPPHLQAIGRVDKGWCRRGMWLQSCIPSPSNDLAARHYAKNLSGM